MVFCVCYWFHENVNFTLGCSTLSISGVKLCSTHEFKIPSGRISQIDGLEAGSITYEDPSLLVDRKFVYLAHKISW